MPDAGLYHGRTVTTSSPVQRLFGWTFWQRPAVQALVLQLLAGLLTVAFALLLPLLLSPPAAIGFSIGTAVLLQGTLAAALTLWRGLARWWIAIQLLFPVTLLSVLALQLPPLIFLFGFLFLLMLYWSTFRTQVPFYPSRPAVWRAVAALLPAPDASGRAVQVVDIGSGLGGLVLALAVQRPGDRFLGVELAPLPWLISQVRATLTNSAARFTRTDYERLDFGRFDVVFAYLSPTAMPALWQKAQCEMRAGTLLLSYEFAIPDHPPDMTVLPDPQGPPLYGWRR